MSQCCWHCICTAGPSSAASQRSCLGKPCKAWADVAEEDGVSCESWYTIEIIVHWVDSWTIIIVVWVQPHHTLAVDLTASNVCDEL